MCSSKALIALEAHNYSAFAALDLLDQEIDLNIRKAQCGSEYAQKVSTYRTRAEIRTIKMDATILKAQIALRAEDAVEMDARGFRDRDEVEVEVAALPYQIP
jgi:hypothetical protein